MAMDMTWNFKSSSTHFVFRMLQEMGGKLNTL